MNFQPKKDLLYAIVIWLIPQIILTFIIFIHSKILLIVFGLLPGLSIWIWNGTNYNIEIGELLIKFLIIRK